MKEKYFTRENLTFKAKNIKTEITHFLKHPKFEFTNNTSKESALLVMDMQKFFRETSSHACIPSFDAVIPNIKKLINTFKKSNRPVIFTRHINTEENAALMGEWWRDILTEDDKYSLIAEDFDTSGHIVIKKSQYDAFYNTNLEEKLKEFKIKNLVITGVMTHLCCETTARAAFVRGFSTFFVIDGTATYNEKFHKNSIFNLSHGFSVPILTEEITANF